MITLACLGEERKKKCTAVTQLIDSGRSEEQNTNNYKDTRRKEEGGLDEI